MATILVTGGCGFIGSHTIVDLLENGYDVISIDDNSRSTDIAIAGIEKITGKKIKNHAHNSVLLKFWGFTGLASLLAYVQFPAVENYVSVNPQISEARCR